MNNEEMATLSSEELWDYCLKEYSSSNMIVGFLLNRFYKKIASIVFRLPSNFSFLEVGCGAGESSRRIFPFMNGRHYEASDYDQRYVDMIMLKSSPPYRVTVESVYELKRKDKEFDCLIMLEVLEHLENVDKALKEIFRVAKKRVIISVPDEPIWSILNLMRLKYIKSFGNTPGHINRWAKKECIKLLSRYGKVSEVYTPLPWMIFVVEVDENSFH